MHDVLKLRRYGQGTLLWCRGAEPLVGVRGEAPEVEGFWAFGRQKKIANSPISFLQIRFVIKQYKSAQIIAKI